MQLSDDAQLDAKSQTSDSPGNRCSRELCVFAALSMGVLFLLAGTPDVPKQQSPPRFLQVFSAGTPLAEGDSVLATDGFIVSRFEAGFDANVNVQRPYIWVPGAGMKNTGEVTFHMYCEESENDAVSVSATLSGGSSASNSIYLELDGGSKPALHAPRSYEEWATKTVTLTRRTTHARAHTLSVLGREDGTRVRHLTINNDAFGTNCFFMRRPGGVFDLRPWKLQTDVADDAGNIVSYNWPGIASHISKSFYIDRSGSMIFRASVNGATTSGSGYPRMELREMTSGRYELKKAPAQSDFGASDWSLYEGSHVLKVRCAVLHLPEGKPQVIVGQIHGSEYGSEIIKLRASLQRDGSIKLQPQVKMLNTEAFDVNNTVEFVQISPVFSKQPIIGEVFEYTIKMQHGVLSTTLGDETIFHDYNVPPYKKPYTSSANRRRRKVDNSDDRYYFKVGAYCNAAYGRTDGGNDDVVDGDECVVAVHSINLAHSE